MRWLVPLLLLVVALTGCDTHGTEPTVGRVEAVLLASVFVPVGDSVIGDPVHPPVVPCPDSASLRLPTKAGRFLRLDCGCRLTFFPTRPNYPLIMAELIPGSFSVDHLGIYPGLIHADEPKKGPVRPLFTFDIALNIIADWIEFESLPDEPMAEAFYDADRDTFRLFEPATHQWHELEGERYGPNTLYAMGRDLWTWERSPKIPA